MKRVLGHGSYKSLKNYDSVIVVRGPVVKPADLPLLSLKSMRGFPHWRKNAVASKTRRRRVITWF